MPVNIENFKETGRLRKCKNIFFNVFFLNYELSLLSPYQI